MLYLDIDCTMSIDVTKGSPMSEIRFNLHSVVILFTPFLPNKQTQLSCTLCFPYYFPFQHRSPKR